MSLTNPTPIVQQMVDQLLLCPSVIAKGITTEVPIWYPSIPLQTATLPGLLVVETAQERQRYAEGAIPLISGTFKIVFYEAGTDPGQMEAFARQLAVDLGSQYYGLCFRSFSVGLCSDPTPGQRAVGGNADYRSISLTVQYGLTR